MPVRIKVLSDGSAGGAAGDKIIDEVFGEVLGGARTPFDSTLDLQAQVVYKAHDKRDPVIAGDQDVGDGHLCFILEYLESVGLDPLGSGDKIKKGDRIIEIAGETTDYRIIEMRPAGHIKTADIKPMLWLAYFEFPADVHSRVV